MASVMVSDKRPFLGDRCVSVEPEGALSPIPVAWKVVPPAELGRWLLSLRGNGPRVWAESDGLGGGLDLDPPLRNSSWLVDQLCDPAGDRWPLSDAGRQWGGPEGLGVSSGSGFVGWGPGCQGAVQRGAAAALPLQWCRLSLPPLNFVSQAQVGPGRRGCTCFPGWGPVP